MSDTHEKHLSTKNECTGGRVDQRKNCLNSVRLFAAISVFYIHAILHLEVSMPQALTTAVSFFQGVPIFFALSGYFVWDSAGRSENFFAYAKKRILRVYPELWCAVLLGLVGILLLYKGPVDWIQLGVFTVTQGTVLQFWTPDFLRGYGCGTPNGALWTICVMVQFYIVVYFARKLLCKIRTRTWFAILTGFVLAAVASPLLKGMVPVIVYKLYRQTLIPHAWLFLLGTILAAKREIFFPYLQKFWGLLLVLSGIFLVSGVDVRLGDYGLFSCATLIPGVIGFAYRCPRWNIGIDISYGIYIYHMIVVNAMIALGFTKNSMYLLMALMITCLLAFVSNRTIGRMAISFKTNNNIS